MEKQKIAFIGTGVMGASIVKHLLNVNYEVHIFTRTMAKAEQLINLGAIWHDTAAKAAENATIVFTMVGYPSDVEEVYFGETGVFSTVKENTVIVDMTTSQPKLAIKIAEYAKTKNIESLDAPVSGGDIGAQNGTLSIMVGGEEATFKKLTEVFEVFGKNIVYQGKAGAGQHTKMCNQIAIATNMIGVAEALVYGKRAGLKLETVLKSIEAGAAGSWSLSNLGPRMMKSDEAPGFYIKHFLKDMRIALDEAKNMNLNLPGLELSEKMYAELSESGKDDFGTQAIYSYYK